MLRGVGRVIGPAISGLLIAITNPSFVIALGSIPFLLVSAILFTIPKNTDESILGADKPENILTSLATGWSEFKKTQMIVGIDLAGHDFAACCFGTGLYIGFSAFCPCWTWFIGLGWVAVLYGLWCNSGLGHCNASQATISIAFWSVDGFWTVTDARRACIIGSLCRDGLRFFCQWNFTSIFSDFIHAPNANKDTE